MAELREIEYRELALLATDERAFTLAELEAEELLELPERELMTGCGGSLLGVGVSASVSVCLSANVSLGGGGTCK